MHSKKAETKVWHIEWGVENHLVKIILNGSPNRWEEFVLKTLNNQALHINGSKIHNMKVQFLHVCKYIDWHYMNNAIDALNSSFR